MNTRSASFAILLMLLALALPTVADPGAEEALCPVCRVNDGETELEPVVATAEHQGHTYGFCSVGCRDTFLEAPESYIPPVFPRPAPPFTVRDLEGEELALTSLRGRPVLLDFWATWCAPCVTDLPQLSRLHERYAEDGLTVLSVSINEGKRALRKVSKMVEKTQATHPVYLDDAEDPAWHTYRVRVVPTQFLIDPEGNIVAQWSGTIDFEKVEAEIVRLLEGSGTSAGAESR